MKITTNDRRTFIYKTNKQQLFQNELGRILNKIKIGIKISR